MSKQQGLTLQINSMEILEKLLGGDAEAMVNVRSAIVQDFTTKYLKSIVGNAEIQKSVHKLENALINSVDEEVKKQFGAFKKDVWGRFQFDADKLTSNVKEKIKTMAEVEVSQLIEASVKIAVEKIKGEIDSYIKNKIKTEIQYHIDYVAKEQLEEMGKKIRALVAETITIKK